jgi:D-tagatose-1,6-bisphosphate aldolase subunit GatZ/KbaZ
MPSTPRRKSSSGEKLKDFLEQNRRSGSGGVYSVCSAHPQVIEAAIQQGTEDNAVLLLESTSSQVNQEGGYTGQSPQRFAGFIRSAAEQAGLAADQVLLGGDHLGPYPWRAEDSSAAMEKARLLVRACVLAGYQKIHLDASMPCADDAQNPLDARTVAQRAAELAEAAESAFAELPPGSPPPVYVIGTEVPVPGGETEPGSPPAVTTSAHVQHTLETFRSVFAERNVSAAWERVLALVVQPGVEFGDDVVFPYDREKVRPLSTALPKEMPIVYEAHSTDYQSPRALRKMVEDHFAILKVGPWLTFAFREAVFALSAIEWELLGGDKTIRFSEVRQALENVMLRNPTHWRAYYHGSEAELRLSRAYSFSDRCRYYWHEQEVKDEVERLLVNLSNQALPVTLLSQFLPVQYEAVRDGLLPAKPGDLIRHHIQAVLREYAEACGFKTTLAHQLLEEST